MAWDETVVLERGVVRKEIACSTASCEEGMIEVAGWLAGWIGALSSELSHCECEER